MDDLASLILQMEWGADEALLDAPVDRRAATPSPTPPATLAQPTRPLLAQPAILPGATPAVRAQALADAAADLPALEQAVAGFDGSGLRATATTLVFGAGPADAKVMLIQGVPCAPEDRAGLPFAGPFLDRMLHSAGLDRAQVRTASLLPWRPPGDRKPTEAEIATCLPFLHRHLALVRPRGLVLFGALAAKTLLPAAGRRRVGWLPLAVLGLAAPIPALCVGTTLHIQATPAAKRDAWAALLMLRRSVYADHE